MGLEALQILALTMQANNAGRWFDTSTGRLFVPQDGVPSTQRGGHKPETSGCLIPAVVAGVVGLVVLVGGGARLLHNSVVAFELPSLPRECANDLLIGSNSGDLPGQYDMQYSDGKSLKRTVPGHSWIHPEWLQNCADPGQMAPDSQLTTLNGTGQEMAPIVSLSVPDFRQLLASGGGE